MRGRLLAVAVLVVVAGLVSGFGSVVGADVPARVESRLHPLKYEAEIAAAAARHAVDPYLVAAVVKAESGYDPDVVSPAGAVGLMQVMPDTATWIAQREDWAGGPVGDLTDPIVNLELGVYYLAFLIDLFDGDIRSAVAAYNAGQGAVSAWLRGAGTGEASLEPADIPYAETRGFVQRVEKFRAIYLRAHPGAFLT